MSGSPPSSALRLVTADGPTHLSLHVPGSKSVCNRVLICSALAKGSSRIGNIAPGDDTSRMIECLQLLGIAVTHEDSSVIVEGGNGVIQGGMVLDAGLAGTTSRFLSAVAALGTHASTITGAPPLRNRPMGDLYSALRALGAEVVSLGEDDRLPVAIRRGEISGGRARIRGDVSSQFISALMLIAPYLEGGLALELETPLVSRPYVDMTSRIMSTYGVQGVEVDRNEIHIPEGRYMGCDLEVEPDASSASYPLAAAAILGGSVRIDGMSKESLQGDIRILEILGAMGCTVIEEGGSCTVTSSGELHGIDIDMSSVSDLVPTIAATALFCSTPTRIRNVGFIRAKESDRIGDLIRGIQMIGGRADEFPDGLEIQPMEIMGSEEVVPPTHHDHRLAMAWSLIALRRSGIFIDDPMVVNKSWPQWWTVREALCRAAVG